MSEHEKFDLKEDEWGDSDGNVLHKLTYWSTPHSGISFRMPPADLLGLHKHIGEYLQAEGMA